MKTAPGMHLLDSGSFELQKAATRNAFGDALAEIGEQDETVVALSADVAGSVQVAKFGSKFPGRFFNVGVAEQNMAAVASGLSYCGKIAFIGAFAIFSPGRNWEQIRTTVCLANANVKIEGSHAGIEAGEDGGTHQALEDIAILRPLPNITILSPCDAQEAKKATYAAWKTPGPFYIRCTRGALPTFTTPDTPFEVGKLNLLCEGSDIALVATGGTVYESLMAASALEKQGISVAVANMHTISHPDASALEKLARECGRIVTVEDHSVKGGMGGAVCETLAQSYPVRVRRLGMERFGESGKGAELLKKYGLEREGIARAAKEEIARKE
jgi:transketolase